MIEHLDDTVILDPTLSRLDVHNVLVNGVNLAWKARGNNATVSTCANFVAYIIQENERMRAALNEVIGIKDDTLGERGDETPRPVGREHFDRGCRMAFYRCAAIARAALEQDGHGNGK